MSAVEEPISTRHRLVKVARELFYEHGYAATSLADILQQAKVNSGSLYYFFKSKEALLLAVLENYKGRLWPEVVEPAFSRVDDPIERIFAILEIYGQSLVSSNFTRGCPIGNLALELSDHYPQVREKITENFSSWRGWIRKCLEDASDRLPSHADPDRMSAFILAVMEGGVMQARAEQSIKPFEAGVAELRDYFDRLLDARQPV